MIVRRKFAGGLLKTGKVIRAAVNNPGFKSLGKKIQKRLKDSLEDQNLAKSATKYEKARALLGALKNFTKSAPMIYTGGVSKKQAGWTQDLGNHGTEDLTWLL